MSKRKHFTRRDFLASTSLATAGALLSSRSAHALAKISGTKSGNDLLPQPVDPVDFESLATAAVDIARKAGASYADIRIAEIQDMGVHQVMELPLIPDVSLRVNFNYGIRVLVDGVWSFAYGTSSEIDSIAENTRHAVSVARTTSTVKKTGGRQLNNNVNVPFVPPPAVKGRWSTPVKVDPFSIPMEDQIALIWACQNSAWRVPGAARTTYGYAFSWLRETRTFASSEGSLVTQTFYRSLPFMSPSGDRGMGTVALKVKSLSYMSGGYELVQSPGLQDEVKAVAEEAVRLARLPQRGMDVGRYPVVVDGVTFGTLLNLVAGQSLELDRAIGSEAGTSGTSFLSPVDEVLGAEMFSPLLNVTANRNFPAINSAKWDDEGVETREYPVIESGRVVDYHTSCENASVLSAWYKKRGVPVRSNGCVVSPETDNPLLVRPPQLEAKPGDQRASIDDLAKGIKRGLLVRDSESFSLSTDQKLISGSLIGNLVLEIENGRVVRRIRDSALQLNTKALWKSLAAVGDPHTVNNSTAWLFKGQPWIMSRQSIKAPAGFFKDVDVISTGRKI